MVKVAWAEVMATCVRNCFRKAGFVDAEPSKEDQSGGDFWQCVVDSKMGSHDIGWNILFLLTKMLPLRNHARTRASIVKCEPRATWRNQMTTKLRRQRPQARL
ncbi:hypothetical protein HPB49_026078 [Dermacentor silvarum]|nr:hypothetical protein HPB49_026078 [Dermacentor silvarum]